MTLLRDLLVRARRTRVRLLHPLRRRKALAALRTRPRPTKLLVVCHGNLVRSPFAAAVLSRELAPAGIDVRSAGFIGFDRPAPAEAVAAAARHDVDLTAHRSRLLTTELVRTTDLIVVMDRSQRREIVESFGGRSADVVLLVDFDPEPVETRRIQDPLNQSSAVFEQVYEQIARCGRALVSAVSA